MSTKNYADFISGQQAKLRGAGMIDEETSQTITANIPRQAPGNNPLPPIPHVIRDHEELIKLGKEHAKHGIKHTIEDHDFKGPNKSGFNKYYQFSNHRTHTFEIPPGTHPDVVKSLKSKVEDIAAAYK